MAAWKIFLVRTGETPSVIAELGDDPEEEVLPADFLAEKLFHLPVYLKDRDRLVIRKVPED